MRRVLLLASVLATAPLFAQVVATTRHVMATTRYDKFKGRTVVDLFPPTTQTTEVKFSGEIHATTSVRLMEFSGTFVCPGRQESCRPEAVKLLFLASTSNWEFGDLSRSCLFSIDGQTVNGGKYDWDGEVLGAEDLLESMDIDVPPSVLERISTAQSVDVQLGGLYEFSLTRENIAAAKALAARLTPQPRPNSPAKKPAAPLELSDGTAAQQADEARKKAESLKHDEAATEKAIRRYEEMLANETDPSRRRLYRSALRNAQNNLGAVQKLRADAEKEAAAKEATAKEEQPPQ